MWQWCSPRIFQLPWLIGPVLAQFCNLSTLLCFYLSDVERKWLLFLGDMKDMNINLYLERIEMLVIVVSFFVLNCYLETWRNDFLWRCFFKWVGNHQVKHSLFSPEAWAVIKQTMLKPCLSGCTLCVLSLFREYRMPSIRFTGCFPVKIVS